MPTWLHLARSYIGLKEIRGEIDNPTIIQWLKRHALNIGRWGKNRDETPWCAVFVSHCLSEAGIEPTNDARAISYASWGRASKPRPGAVIVIRRKRKDGENRTGSNRGGYHVGFLTRMTGNYMWIVGGNQRNSVSKAGYSKKNYELIALRWPEGRDD